MKLYGVNISNFSEWKQGAKSEIVEKLSFFRLTNNRHLKVEAAGCDIPNCSHVINRTFNCPILII